MGKRLLRLPVVHRNGKTLSFTDSLLRYAIFAIAFYLDNLALPTTKTPWIVSTVLSVITGSVGVATLYLVVFNRHTRQGLHDLAVGSFVADAEQTAPVIVKPIWNGHWAILGMMLLVGLIGGNLLMTRLSKSQTFAELLEDVRLVEGMPGVQVAGGQALLNPAGKRDAKRVLVITVHWTGGYSGDETFRDRDEIAKTLDAEAFSDEVAKTLFQGDSKIDQLDALRIVVQRGYNIGIAKSFVNHSFQHTPTEWRERLGLAVPQGTSQ